MLILSERVILVYGWQSHCPADCIIVLDSQSQPRTQWCCATLSGGIPKEVPRDGAWLNEQEFLSLLPSIKFWTSCMDCVCMHCLVLTGIAHCTCTLLLAGLEEHCDNSSSRSAPSLPLSLMLSLCPPIPDKTPPLHLSVTPSLLHMICSSLLPSWSRR